jgi:hypothetical protein
LEALNAIVEDLPDFVGDEEFVDERAPDGSVVYGVVAGGAAEVFSEAVLVDPLAVGAAKLLVDETMRRVPDGDFAAPTDRDAADFEAVVDFGALPDVNGRRRENVKLQRGWSEFLEIHGVREKGEDFLDRARQPKARFKSKNLHVIPLVRILIGRSEPAF